MPEVRYVITGDAASAVDASRQATSGLEQLKQKTEEIGKETEKATFSHRQMHQALHQIGEKAPEIGIALKAMASGPAAGLAVLMVLLKQTQEGIENLNKNLTTSNWDTTKIDAIGKSLADAAIEAAKFARELEAAAKAQATIAEKAEAIAKLHSAEGSATDKVRAAQKKFELDQTESIKDPEEKKRKRAEIEIRYAIDEKNRKDADDRFKVNEDHRSLANEGFFQEHNGAKIKAARQKLAGLGKVEDVDEKIATEKKRSDDIEKEMAEKQKRFDELESKPWLRRSTPEQTEKNYLGQQLEQLGGLKTSTDVLRHRMERERPAKIIGIQSAQEELSGLESEQMESVKRSTKLREQIPLESQIFGIESNARGQVIGTSIASQVAQGNMGLPQAGQMAELAGAVKPDAHFAKLPQDMAQLLKIMSTFVQAVPGLQKQIEELRHQIAASRINHGP